LRDTRDDKVPRVISDITHAEKFSTNNFFANFLFNLIRIWGYTNKTFWIWCSPISTHFSMSFPHEIEHFWNPWSSNDLN
jgi:hypothetical protein